MRAAVAEAHNARLEARFQQGLETRLDFESAANSQPLVVASARIAREEALRLQLESRAAVLQDALLASQRELAHLRALRERSPTPSPTPPVPAVGAVATSVAGVASSAVADFAHPAASPPDARDQTISELRFRVQERAGTALQRSVAAAAAFVQNPANDLFSAPPDCGDRLPPLLVAPPSEAPSESAPARPPIRLDWTKAPSSRPSTAVGLARWPALSNPPWAPRHVTALHAASPSGAASSPLRQPGSGRICANWRPRSRESSPSSSTAPWPTVSPHTSTRTPAPGLPWRPDTRSPATPWWASTLATFWTRRARLGATTCSTSGASGAVGTPSASSSTGLAAAAAVAARSRTSATRHSSTTPARARRCASAGSRDAPSLARSLTLLAAWGRASPSGGTTTVMVPARPSLWMRRKASGSPLEGSPASPAPVKGHSRASGGGGSRSPGAREAAAASDGTSPAARLPLPQLFVCAALLCCAAAAGASLDPSAGCMPAPSERTVAFRNTVVFNLGAGAADGVRWNARTTVPTLASLAPLRALAARRGWDIEAWLFDDSARTTLEAAEGRWRPAIAALALAPGVVSSIGASLGHFNTHICPHERNVSTRHKYLVQRISALTWAVWKGCLPQLLPMSDDLLRAYIWDCLAFETSHSVLKHTIGAIKAWHQRFGMAAPVDLPGDYRRLTTSLARFQPCPRTLQFPIHAAAVRRLLLLPFPAQPPCGGVLPPKPRGKWVRCPTCWAFLHRWFDCMAGATGTIICSRCKELGLMTTCDIWFDYDAVAGFLQFVGGAAFNIGIRKNDQFRLGHQARVGVPKDPRLDLLAAA
jgi:hypothetical protein